MNKLTTSLLCFGAVLLLFMGALIGDAQAQVLADENTPTAVYVVDGDCEAPASCNMSDAVTDATDGGAGSTMIFALIPQTNGLTTFNEDLNDNTVLFNTVDMPISISTSVDGATATPGQVEIRGDVFIDIGGGITVAKDTELRFGGQDQLRMQDATFIDGPGTVVFPATSGSHEIQLGDPFCPAVFATTVAMENVRVNKSGGTVTVRDECDNDIFDGTLEIDNRLNVANGTLDMGENILLITGPTLDPDGPDAGVFIDDDGDGTLGEAQIFGDNLFTVLLTTFVPNVACDHVAGGVPAVTCAYPIAGEGDLRMAFSKDSEDGVSIELNVIGSGDISFNNSGSLFVTTATQLDGSFENNGAARTEFWSLTEITTDLEINGPGDEIDPTDTPFINDPTCDTDDVFSGNESGVYFFTPVTIGDQLKTFNTDDPGTDCVEGVWFMGDPEPERNGPPPVAASKASNVPNGLSTVKGNYTSSDPAGGPPAGAVGVFLGAGAGSTHHNVAFESDFIFDDSPIFILADPADVFDSVELCDTYEVQADGNKVLFTGANDQDLRYDSLLDIKSVEFNKADSDDEVEINELSALFQIDTSIEILKGTFVTNGLLDANSTADPNGGATVEIFRGLDGTFGKLDRGTGEEAYAGATGANAENLPMKIKYVGDNQHFTADEVPGDASGSLGAAEVIVPYLEMFSDPGEPSTSVLTTSKDFMITHQLRLTNGDVQVGSSDIIFGNGMQIALGNGDLLQPLNQNAGQYIFPDVPAAATNADGIDLQYFGTRSPRAVSYEWPNRDGDVPSSTTGDVTPGSNVIRNVEVGPECGDGLTVFLREDEDFQLNPDGPAGTTRNDNPGFNIYGADGPNAFDIAGQDLYINADNGVDNEVLAEVEGDLWDTTDPLEAASARITLLAGAMQQAFEAYKVDQSDANRDQLGAAEMAWRAARTSADKAAVHAGEIVFIGDAQTDVLFETDDDNLRRDTAALRVDRDGESDACVTFDMSGVLSTTTGDVPANNADELHTSHFTIDDATLGDDDLSDDDACGVQLWDGLDILEVHGYWDQFDGEVLMAGVSSLGGPGVKEYVQTVNVGAFRTPGDTNIDNGEVFMSAGDWNSFGDYFQGTDLASMPGDALFALQGGEHTVVGDFLVGPDTDPAERPTHAPEDRNRYELGGICGIDINNEPGGLFFNGDYHLWGTGDRFDDNSWPTNQQGLHGNVTFTGAALAQMGHRQDEDAFLCDFSMKARTNDNDGVEQTTHLWMNEFGVLRLEHGIIDGGMAPANAAKSANNLWDFIILNPGFELDLAGRNNSGVGFGVVDLGSRDSYVDGRVARVNEGSNATGGVITGGYLYPNGVRGEGRDDGGVGDRDVDFWRPLILQYPDDLGRTSTSASRYVGIEGQREIGSKTAADDRVAPEDCEWPEGNLFVDDVGDEPLELDVIGDQFWRLEFDRIPSFDPNTRLIADELPNIFNIKKLRIIQWDCDCTNPRLAGLYDVTGGVVDDASAVLNDFIDSLPNITQEGVDVEACQILGIASNFLENPINLPELPGGLSRIQFVHNNADLGDVDVYAFHEDSGITINLTRDIDDGQTFQTGSPAMIVPGGSIELIVMQAGVEIARQTTTASANSFLSAVANPGTGGKAINLDILGDLNLDNSEGENLEARMFNGAPNRAPSIDIRQISVNTPRTVEALIANNFGVGSSTSYFELPTGGLTLIEVTPGDDNATQIAVLGFELSAFDNETAIFAVSDAGHLIFGVDADGNEIIPADVTADEDPAELPGEFALRGNYPNPFNPTTTLQIDLPETAEVTVEIIDMLGRNVMAVPAKVMEAGAARSIEVNAISLASGTYLYRVIAKTASDTMVKTGRMMLIK